MLRLLFVDVYPFHDAVPLKNAGISGGLGVLVKGGGGLDVFPTFFIYRVENCVVMVARIFVPL